MNYTLLLVPFVAALASWLMIKIAIASLFKPYKPVKIFGLQFRGVLPKLKDSYSKEIARTISNEILKSDLINKKLTGVETLEKSMPVIEEHIDNFLNHKLKEAIPVISMFVGEKIINQLKELFLQELKELFPSIMSQFIGNLSQSGEVEKEIVLKLHSISVADIEVLFYKNCKNSFRRIEIGFAIGGFIAGAAQLLITLMIVK